MVVNADVAQIISDVMADVSGVLEGSYCGHILWALARLMIFIVFVLIVCLDRNSIIRSMNDDSRS